MPVCMTFSASRQQGGGKNKVMGAEHGAMTWRRPHGCRVVRPSLHPPLGSTMDIRCRVGGLYVDMQMHVFVYIHIIIYR